MSLYTLKEHDGTYFKQRGDSILPVGVGNIDQSIRSNVFSYLDRLDNRRFAGEDILETPFLKRLKFYIENSYTCFYTEEVEKKIRDLSFNYYRTSEFLEDIRNQVIFLKDSYVEMRWSVIKGAGPTGVLTKHQLFYYRRTQRYRETFNVYQLAYKKAIKKITAHFGNFYGKDKIYVTSEREEISIEINRGDLYIQNLTAKHLLRDMYIRFKFTMTKNHANLLGLSGARLTITKNEKAAYYNHSHLSGDILGYWQPFCLGSSVVDSYFSIPIEYDDTEEWEDLFMHTEHLIGFEDTNNPYKRISRITTELPDISNEGSQRVDKITFRELLQSLKIKLNTNGDYTHYTYDITANVEGISNTYLSVSMGDKEISYNTYLNKLSSMKNYQTDKVVSTRLSENKIFGEKVPCKVIDTENDIPEGLEPHLRPGVLKYISNKLDLQLINKIYEYNKQQEAKVTSN